VQSASQRLAVYGCKLTRQDLDALWQTITRDMSQHAHASVSTERGISKTEETSLDELVAKLNAPERLDNLVMYMSDRGSAGDPEDRRTAYLGIDKNNASGSVSGPDETWVRGRSAELQDLLKSSRARLALHPESGMVPAILVGSLSAIFMVTLLTLIASSFVDILDGAPVRDLAVRALSLLAFTGLSVAFWRWGSRKIRTEIILVHPTGRGWSRGDRLGLAALIVGILAAVGTMAQVWMDAHR
jgi:hypothetical protein